MLDDAVEIYEVLGNRVRQTRTARGITLEQLATLTGFTTSYLSKIENRRKVPPIATLARIARALEVDIAYFFEGERATEDETVSVVRANERQPVIRGGTTFGYDYEGLAHTKRNKHMEPFVFTFPSSMSKDVSFEHEGEEFVFVLSGRVKFEAGGRSWVLQAGDSLYTASARCGHDGP
jgi:transcriptional regulator with XRE-family HTH domain